MTYQEFTDKMFNLDLWVREYSDTVWSITGDDKDSPLLYVNPQTTVIEYDGYIHIKSINLSEYTDAQIRLSLECLNELLLTPIEERGKFKDY